MARLRGDDNGNGDVAKIQVCLFALNFCCWYLTYVWCVCDNSNVLLRCCVAVVSVGLTIHVTVVIGDDGDCLRWPRSGEAM